MSGVLVHHRPFQICGFITIHPHTKGRVTRTSVSQLTQPGSLRKRTGGHLLHPEHALTTLSENENSEIINSLRKAMSCVANFWFTIALTFVGKLSSMAWVNITVYNVTHSGGNSCRPNTQGFKQCQICISSAQRWQVTMEYSVVGFAGDIVMC